MDRRVIDYLERKMRVSRDNESRGRGRDRDYDYERDERRGVRGTGPYGIGGRRYYGGRDRADRDYDMNMSRSYDDRDYERGGRDYRDMDYERGGRGDHRGGGDYRDYRGGDYDYADRDYDYDYNMHQEMKLTKEDMHHWKQKMRNEDGTKGEHYDMQQIMHAVEKLGIKMQGFDEKELCLVVNMLYSDYCKVVKKYVPIEKELMFYVDMARAFLDDADGPEPSEKLALYYYCIVDNDKV